MPVTAAIGAGIGAVGSVGSALIGSKAAKDASAAQVAMQTNALNTQKGMFQQGLDLVQPFVDAGKSAGKTLLDLLTPGPNQTQVLSQLPGFQFAQDWGQKAVNNLGTTLGLGGNTLKAGADYATGVAQQGFGTLAGLLQNVFGTGATAAGTGFNNSTAAGTSIANTTTGIGNAQASGILGSANALSTGITGATNSASNALLLNKLFSTYGGGRGSNGMYTDNYDTNRVSNAGEG